MRPQLLKVVPSPDNSFMVRRDRVPHINNRWHYHKELELIHFKCGSGTQFIGDDTRRFKSGDVILVGKDLPHYWRFDDHFFSDGSIESADIHVAHFCENFCGDSFFLLPENKGLKTLLERSQRGLQVEGNARRKIAEILDQLLHATGTKKILLLVEALYILSTAEEEIHELSSIGFKGNAQECDGDRINAIIDYSIKRFKKGIALEEISGIANLSSNAFCRYFKSKTRKTYSRFLIELKVGHACKMLIENKQSIKQICYESGFNNSASFHKYFKIITGKSPRCYQKEFIK